MKQLTIAFLILLSFQSMASADGISCTNDHGAIVDLASDEGSNIVGRLFFNYNRASIVCDGEALNRIKETGATKCVGMWNQGISRTNESKEISFEVKFATTAKKILTVSFPVNWDQRDEKKVKIVTVNCN